MLNWSMFPTKGHPGGPGIGTVPVLIAVVNSAAWSTFCVPEKPHVEMKGRLLIYLLSARAVTRGDSNYSVVVQSRS